jgi:hypothetical protein
MRCSPAAPAVKREGRGLGNGEMVMGMLGSHQRTGIDVPPGSTHGWAYCLWRLRRRKDGPARPSSTTIPLRHAPITCSLA